MYVFELVYEGGKKAENVRVATGNANATLPAIEKNQSISVGSTFAPDAKQINVAVSWKEGDRGFNQNLLFDVK